MTHSRYNQYLKEVQISYISLGWLSPISKTKLPICLRRFASGGFLLKRPAFAILSPSPSFCLHHPCLPSPSTKTAHLVDEPPFCLHHPPKRRFWWTNRPFAFTIHQNGSFGGRTALSPSPSTKTAFLVDGAWKVPLKKRRPSVPGSDFMEGSPLRPPVAAPPPCSVFGGFFEKCKK